MESVVTHRTTAPPDEVYRVLADGWSYPAWVVGASRMREVDAAWPDPGARLHHSVGAWPLLIDDTTEVLAGEPGHRLRLLAHARPLGHAEIEITLEPDGGGCLMTMREKPVGVPGRLAAPVATPALGPRNRESLRRLALLAERRDHVAAERSRSRDGRARRDRHGGHDRHDGADGGR